MARKRLIFIALGFLLTEARRERESKVPNLAQVHTAAAATVQIQCNFGYQNKLPPLPPPSKLKIGLSSPEEYFQPWPFHGHGLLTKCTKINATFPPHYSASYSY